MPVCRICLVRDTMLYDIVTCDLKMSYETLTSCLLPEDGLPGMLCWECRARLLAFARFRAKALNSQALLSTMAPFNQYNLAQKLQSIDRHKLNLISSLCTQHLNHIGKSMLIVHQDENTQERPTSAATDRCTLESSGKWNHVKGEWDGEGVSEAARSGLYAEHEVKPELVLGPEQLQPQDIAFYQGPLVKEEPPETTCKEENRSDCEITLDTVKVELESENSFNQFTEDSSTQEICDASYDSDIEESWTPPDLIEIASKMKNDLLPETSRKKYEKCYKDFMEWKTIKNASSFSENVLLAYFQDMSNKYKSSSLWTKHSILKSTLNVKHDVDITKYTKLVAYLRRISQGFTGKKSKTFSPEAIKRFLNEAPNQVYLSTKVALIFGIMGSCRRQELYHLQFQDVHVFENTITVNINSAKTKRSFYVTGYYSELCKQYMELRPPCSSQSFFLNFKLGKCSTQKIGINKFGNQGKIIASYLGLPEPELYTGHCFRRTSAVLSVLVDEGGDITK